jgi:MOSC domain-containing protein YiiM
MYWKGQVLSIYVRSEPGGPVIELDEVLAVPGKGLKGDYYFSAGSPRKPGPGRELTLIEMETLEAVEKESNIRLNPEESRRNVITKNVPLNHLIGKEFQVGDVILKGIRLCEPCSHLAELTQKEILPALVHRGGLRAQIISEGLIRTGDPVYAINSSPAQEATNADFNQGP